jgi:hypothetical protein
MFIMAVPSLGEYALKTSHGSWWVGIKKTMLPWYEQSRIVKRGKSFEDDD